MLVIRSVDKTFGATRAVRNVSLEAAPGSVLGLVGENGAGKSTVMKIVGGAVRPDRGEMSLDGQPLAGLEARGALARGIASVFQELTLIRSLTVGENMSLLRPPSRPTRSIARREMFRSSQDILDRYGVKVRAETIVGALPLGEQQMVEIVRAVERAPTVLLLDEATAALGAAEVEWLARLVGAERARGTIILFISHRWDEIETFCDRVAVMRNGELVAHAAARDMSHDQAVALMTGRHLGAVFPPRAPAPSRTVLLHAEGLESEVLRGVTLGVASGEILGLGGLVGQGQDALLKSLFGDHALRAGTVSVMGRETSLRSPGDAIRHRIAYVPQERKVEGLLLQKSVATNLSLVILKALSRWGCLVDRRRECEVVSESIAHLQVRAASPSVPISTLSGGNQQKVLLQKWLLTKPAVLLLNDVTRGVDIGTKQQSNEIIAELARAGLGVVLFSTDGHELVELAHRVLVISEGRVAAELSGKALTAESIVRASTGGEARRATAA